jgi:hypothetical protein
MTTPSPKMGLALPAQVDQFSTQDIKENWEKIDAAPGTHICTSTTRPTGWGNAQKGRKILETNTGLEWWWDGTAFKRLTAVGLLKKSDGSFAIAERTTNFSTTSNTYKRAITLSNVVVPAGNRPIRVDLSWLKAVNPAGNFNGAIYRSDTDNSGPRMAAWNFPTSADEANSGGGVYWAIERSGLAPGTYDFSFQITGPSGTSTISATTTSPITLMVTEI